MNRLSITLRASLFGSAAVLAVASGSQAFAQDTAPPSEEAVTEGTASDQPGQPEGLGQLVVVTAQKRVQVLLDVPQSVTVIGGDTLERQQATNFQDYLALIPGFSLEASTPGESRITLRGANTGGVATTVAVFMDEVPFGSSTGLANGAILSGDFDPFDLNRIEVLRGPQGTLYGASSFGGVLKFVTNSPKLNKFEVRGQAGIEDTKGGGLGYNSAAVINAPLGDKAAVRVSGFWRKDPGYIDSIGNNPIINALTGEEIGSTLIDHDINDRKTYGGRASLLFQPIDALSVRLTAFAQNLNSGASSTFEVDPETLDPLYGGKVQSLYQREPTKVKYRVYSGTVDWDLGFANLFSSTSYSTFSENFQTDFTFAFGQTVNLLANLGPDVGAIGLPPSFIIADPAVTRPLGVVLRQKTSTDKFTQEVRLSSPNNDTLEWLVGAFYTHEKSGIDPQNIFATEFGTDILAPDVAQLAEIFLRSKYTEYAGFANATWHIVPRFDLTVGGRLSHNKQEADELISGPLVGGLEEFSGLKSNETVFTYSIAPRFEVNEHTSIYARVATGYRPGGPNVLPPDTVGVPLTYDADRLTSWEVGLKAEAPDRLWSLEVAAYHIKWTDIQLFALVNDIGINANGGKARVNGVEVSGTLRPIHGLTIAANGAFTGTKLLDDTPNPEITGGFAGDPLPWVPKWSGAIHADYEFPLGSVEGFVGSTVSYVGKRGIDLSELDENGDVVRVPGYAEVDLRAGVNIDRWTIEAFVQNLFDKGGITAANGFDGASFPNGAAGIAIVRPRTIGLTATIKY
jgi:outer membrane receptor protein involved in Fe transport